MTKHTSAAIADQPLLTVEQAAERLNVSPGYVRRRLIFERRIPHVRIGRYVRIEARVLDELIERGRIQAEDRTEPARQVVRSLAEIREDRLASWRTSANTQ